MDAAKSRFHNVFLKRGGLCDIDTIFMGKDRDNFRDILNSLYRNADIIKRKYPNMPAININFINNPSFNACATIENGEYFIGINMGTLYIITDMFLKIFATKDILSSIGNVDLESEDEKKISILKTEEGLCIDDGEFILPKDELRLSFASAYIDLALNFISIHEIGHIIRGHVAYKDHVFNKGIWDEFEYDVYGRPNLISSTAQTLEMDADSFATNWAFLYAKNFNKNILNIPNSLKMVYHNYESFCSHWAFAIYSCLRLMGFAEINQIEDEKAQHPPPSIRLMMMLSNISPILKSYGIGNVKPMMDKLALATQFCEQAFINITYQENKMDLFLETFFNKKWYMDKITKNWNNVYHLVKPFAFGDLPPLN